MRIFRFTEAERKALDSLHLSISQILSHRNVSQNKTHFDDNAIRVFKGAPLNKRILLSKCYACKDSGASAAVLIGAVCFNADECCFANGKYCLSWAQFFGESLA